MLLTTGKNYMNASVSFKRVHEWIELIKLEHTVFALPFALSGFVLASKDHIRLDSFAWTIVAFTGARTAAMALNRVIDAEIDKANPRTKNRAIPKGMIKKRNAIILAVLSFTLMLGAASQLPVLCLELSPVAVIWLSLYSYSKRITPLCHFALGIALGGAALGGWLAAGGSLDNPSVWFLAMAVTFWVTGFDIIYACQDYDFDKQKNLHSLPSDFGINKALQISRCLHIVTVLALVIAGTYGALGVVYYLGVVLIAGALFYEQTLISVEDLSKVNAAFFNINGFVSILAFITILIDHMHCFG